MIAVSKLHECLTAMLVTLERVQVIHVIQNAPAMTNIRMPDCHRNIHFSRLDRQEGCGLVIDETSSQAYS
jgi:hypothetical protein